MSDVVLDASALLALLNSEKGADRVAEALPKAHFSTVNLAEVVGKLAEVGIAEQEIRESLNSLLFNVHPFDTELAYLAGLFLPQTRHLGLSLGDRSCLALGLKLAHPVMTADRDWKDLKLGVKIQVIR